MHSIPQSIDVPSQDASQSPPIAVTLVQADGVPRVQFSFAAARIGETETIAIADAERLAFRLLDLVLSTKEPIVDPIADRARAHLGSPPPFAPIPAGEVTPSC